MPPRRSVFHLSLASLFCHAYGSIGLQLIRRIIHTPSTTIPTLPPAERLQVVYSYLTSIQVRRSRSTEVSQDVC